MKIFIYFVTILTFIRCSPIKKLYVRYGDASEMMKLKAIDKDIRIYMDRFGSIYPDHEITDVQLQKNYSLLTNLYASDASLCEDIMSNYKLPAASSYEDLQVKLIENAASQINNIDKSKKIIFLIHGFNKHPTLPDGASSQLENQEMKDRIRLELGKECQFVEIYWDGCTWVNGIKAFEFSNSFKIWNNAQAASNNVGLELRRLLCRLNCDNIYVVTHSLGASVITCALFNVDKFKKTSFRDEILRSYADTNNYRTPVQKFHVAIIAPAIPGCNTFKYYHSRTTNSSNGQNNYYFIVGHNSMDRVLKKYVWLSTRFGSTSLGSKRSEVFKVSKSLNKMEIRVIDAIDFSRNSKCEKQKDHAFSSYINNEQPMNKLLGMLFSESKKGSNKIR